MKAKSIISALVMFGVATVVSAQNMDDAIRYTNIVPSGTAKFVSMGGAMGAIGGDLTAITVNPAGIGVYRNGQMTISPMWTTDKETAKYYGTTAKSSSSSFRFSNVGVASALPIDETGLVSFNMGFVYNRLTNFDGGYSVKGYNDVSSLLDKAVDDFNADYWDRDPFYNADLFIYDSSARRYINDYEDFGVYGSNQRQSVTTDGSLGEYSFLMGANINNEWYIGGSLNIVHVDYRHVSKYTEEPDIEDFTIDYFNVTDEFWTTGGGVNLKLGIIGWLSENLRVGAAFHTPTILSLTDDYGTKVESSVWYSEKDDNTGDVTYFTESQSYNSTGTIDWRLTMPSKFIGSVAIVAPEHGMIDLDCEVVNYSAATVNDDDMQIGNEYDELNGRISDDLRTTVNLRVGGEMTFGPAVARAGFGFYGSPYKSSHVNSSAHQLVYSIGAGYRGHLAFIDFGYNLRTKKESKFIYTYNESEAKTKSRIGNFVLTAGFRF